MRRGILSVILVLIYLMMDISHFTQLHEWIWELSFFAVISWILFYRFMSLRISIRELPSRFKLNSLKSAFARVISTQANSGSSDCLYGKFASCYFSYNYIMLINTSNQWARFRGDLGARSFFWTIPPGNFCQTPAYAILEDSFISPVSSFQRRLKHWNNFPDERPMGHKIIC